MNEDTDKSSSLSIFVCGDILNRTRNDGLICSNELSSIIASADYAVCNFEAPIEGHGEPEPKPGTHLSQDKVTISGLKQQGFDLLLLANNHMFDYGKEALDATIKEAKRNNLETLGAGLTAEEAYRPIIKEIKGLTIGMLNACEAQYGEIGIDENKSGYSWIQHPKIESNILNLKRTCDFVVLFAHAGLENYPIPQKEWRSKYKLFCDLGVDVVVGSHPHVPQGFEKYGKSLIFYSLGNFYFDTKDIEDHSFAVTLKLRKNQEPSFEIIQHYTKDKKVQITPKDKWVNIDELNALLEPERYWKLHDKMTLETFNRIKRGIALSIFIPIPMNGSFKDFMKMVFSVFLRRNNVKYKDLYQLHLLKNETYYFVIKNALAEKAIRRYSRDN